MKLFDNSKSNQIAQMLTTAVAALEAARCHIKDAQWQASLVKNNEPLLKRDGILAALNVVEEAQRNLNRLKNKVEGAP